jgi:hypothetical protein
MRTHGTAALSEGAGTDENGGLRRLEWGACAAVESRTCLAAESPRTVAIHAGQLFDGKSDRLTSKQVIVVQGQRIADVGPEGSVKIPPGAEEIDLSTATVLPGLIDSHNHMFKVDYTPGDASAAIPADIRPGTVFSPGYLTCESAATIVATFSPP